MLQISPMGLDILLCLLFELLSLSIVFGKKPVITHGVTETFGYENQPASLQCRIRSEISVIVDWYKNGSKVSKSLEYRTETTQLSDDILKCELVFLISQSTVGSYYCNASNEFGWAVSSPANVFVAFMDDEFVAEPQSKIAYIGETITLTCDPPNGSPKPTVTWYQDEKEIDLSNRVQIVDGKNLRIEHVSWGDSGSYTCVAKSPAFEKSSKKAYLRVRQRPVFLVVPKSQTIPVNGVVEFACRVSGEPLPTLTWRRDPPIPVISTTRSMLLADGSLKLVNIQLEDSGIYICQASNDGGVVEAIARLTVTSPPGFVETPPGNAVFLEGTQAQLVCLATGSPIPEIRWINQKTSEYYLNGIKSSSQRITVIKSGSLIINSVRLSDSGAYECRASSPAGFTRTVVHLFVQPNPHLFPGRIGMVTKSPFYIGYSRGVGEVKLICSPPSLSEFYEYMASGARNATEIGHFNLLTTFKTSWYKEEKEIEATASLTERFRMDSEGSLVVKSIHNNDVGNYSCMIFGLMNKRISFWQMQLAPIHLSDSFNKPYLISDLDPPSNVSILSLGDTWISLSWVYGDEKKLAADVRFQVFYLLQFHNSTYVSNRRGRTFKSVHIMNDPNYQGYETPVDSGTIDDGRYPLDLWESAAESTQEKHYTLTGLLPDSGYWVEVRASNSYLWSRGALVSHIVYTAQPTSTGLPSNSHPSEPYLATEDFQALSARVHSLMFLGVSARSLSASEMFVSWAVQTTNDAVKLVDGFKIVAKPVFMSRCSARATSVVKDMANPVSFRTNDHSSFGYGDMTSTAYGQAHCSFNNEQLIERFKQASVNGAQLLSRNRVPEKFVIVSRFLSRESPSTGAVLGDLYPFTCYEVTVKAFKDDQTYGKIWSRETPAQLVLSLDASPSQAPELISADWLGSVVSQNMFHSPVSFANFSDYSSNYPFSSTIRIKWMPLDLHLAHGTLIGYSIHLIANDSSYTQSQTVSPDVNTHDLIGLNPHMEYTIFLAGVTCRGEGVRGPGYRMPILGSGMHPQSSGAEYSVKPVPFPVWAYGAVSGVVVVWLLIGCLFTVCLRRRKPRHNSCRYCSCCCSGSRSTAKAIKNDGSSLKMSSPIATSETKSSHTITTTTTEAQDYTPSDHHSVRLQLKAARNDEAKRLLKGTEGGSEPITMMPGSSSASTPTNTANSMKGRCLPPTANVPYPSGAGGFQAPTPPSAFNVINSMTGFSPQSSSGGQVVHYETHWNDSQLQTSVSSRNNGLLEVPPYASSNVLPPEVSRSSQNNPIKGL